MSSIAGTQTHRVITIYLAGTGNTQQTSKQNSGPDGRYPNGELISTLASNEKGQEGRDWFFVRGLGGRAKNGGREETFPESGKINILNYLPFPPVFTDSLNDNYFLNKIQTLLYDKVEKMFALYWDDKVSKVIRDLKTVIATFPGNPPAVVNLTGWSRGGVTANMVANAMLRDAELQGIAVNIIVFDPVPGAGLGHHNDADKAFTGKNVQSYHAYFARDDRSRAFVPFMPKTHPHTKVKVTVVPGDHGTGAGRVRVLEEGPNETGPETGLLVRDEFEKQLTAWGTRFDNTLDLTPEKIQAYHEQVKKDDADYVKLRTRTRYVFLQEESHGTEERCARYGNDQGHQGHGAGHAEGHTTINEMMATKGFTPVNGGAFLDKGFFIKQPKIPATLSGREEHLARHEKSFNEFMGNLSLYTDSSQDISRGRVKNLLKLRIKEGERVHEKTIGSITARDKMPNDGSMLYNNPGIKKSLIKNLDFLLDNFLHGAINPENYFLDKYKSLWGEDLSSLKEKVAEAVVARLMADTIESFTAMNRAGERVVISGLPAIREKLVSAARQQKKSAISLLADADFSADTYRRLDNDEWTADKDHERQLAAHLLTQYSAQMQNTSALVGDNLHRVESRAAPLAMSIVASYV